MLTDVLIVGMGAGLSVAGYFCARRMSRGSTYYIGRTSVPELCHESGTVYGTMQQEREEIEGARRFAAELEIARMVQHEMEMYGQLQNLRGPSITSRHKIKLLLLLSSQLSPLRDWPELNFSGEDQPEHTERALKLQWKQIDELERRVRALEEKISQPSEESTEPLISKALIN